MYEEGAKDSTAQVSGAARQAPAATLTLTPKAVEMIKKMLAREALDDGRGVRVGVVGGGCSGFQYAMSFDAQKEGDVVEMRDGINLLIDEASLPYLAGTTLDYVEGLHGAGFRFDNPHASRTCGCGSSFSA
ncbi:MAG: iron-sulfur cluster assembly accessory protein [Deltaproteobacteria bacterium]|jgi:iron-sulfur cluster assembly accessory protein|nr:iron-sulfur cluster assembly accessory protein [Deltaproteobacteria bacterium]